MLKAIAQDPTGPGGGTKLRLIEAALETLKRAGFAGTSAREIARTGGFNQALIFYHFGSVNHLLLAALDETSARRMARYRDAVGGARSLTELIDVAARIYREDLESGHITVLAEMIAGSSAHPELGPVIADRIEPWIRFTEEAIAGVLAGWPFEELLPLRDVAFAIVAFYLGVELLTHLQGDRSRADALFGLATRLTPLLTSLLATGTQEPQR
jgi:AcrR family transcriptional regulator